MDERAGVYAGVTMISVIKDGKQVPELILPLIKLY